MPTSFTILAKVSSHSRRGFTQEYHPSHLGVVADRQSALAHFWGSIEAKRPLASAFLGRHASITLMDLNWLAEETEVSTKIVLRVQESALML